MSKRLNILICGLGSIGLRHARLLQKHFDCSLTALRERGTGNELGIPEIRSWEAAKNQNFDAVIIANPTNHHLQTAKLCAENSWNIFLEKPIDASDDGLDALLSLVQERKLTAYVAYPLRFHPAVQHLHQWLSGQTLLHARFVCASYLPNWRPGTDHRETYSAHAKQGGGVLLDLSHEIDLAGYLLGGVANITGKSGRATDITVDSEDYADLLLQHQSGTVSSIHLDYLGLQAQRTIDLDTPKAHARVDLLANTFTLANIDGTREVKSFTVERDDIYLAQLRYFFDNLKNPDLSGNLAQAAPLFRKLVGFKNKA